MNADLGHVGIVLALIGACAGIAVLAAGLRSRRADLLRAGLVAAAVVAAGAVLATVAMERALVTHDFSLAFVAANNSRETPLFYSITGMWAALQGSILLWALVLSGYLLAMAGVFRRRSADPLVGWAMVVALAVAVFFFALMLGPADPFAATRGGIPRDGTGPNPLLQDNRLIAVHPVFLYLGFVGFTVPFAFAIASLVTGRVGEGWLIETRRFTIIAWGCLSVGVVLGAWWSYQTLGWGGYWGWDPVENAAFLPWLTGTAYLHSVMIQERRGLLRIWNLSLLIATFSLTILGTFLTRSGVVVSVHAFSDSGIGPALLAFFGVVVALGVGLIGWRGDRLASPGSIDAPVSREGAFLLNNVLFAAFALVVLLGTVFPLLAQAVSGQNLSIGRPFFDTFGVPIGIALLFFMAIAPALPWRKASSGVLRQRLVVPSWAGALTILGCVVGGIRGLTPLAAFGLGAFAGASALRQLVLAAVAARRHGLGLWRGVVGRANGGMVVHLGVVVIAVALTAASSFAHRGELTLRPGATAVLDGHRLGFLGWAPIATPNEQGVQALVRVDGGGVFRPGLASFNGEQSVGTPSVDSSVVDDVYLSLSSGPARLPSRAPLVLDVVVQPLVLWLWVGGALVGAGSLLAAVPGRRRRPTAPVSVLFPELEMQPDPTPTGAPAEGANPEPVGARR